MTTPRRIAAVSHDIGGARALIPVINELNTRNISVRPFVAGPSAQIWNTECPANPATVVSDNITEDEAVALLKNEKVDRLMSASGLYNRMEHTFRRAGSKLGLPTIAILDSWLNYRERFERVVEEKTEKSWPLVFCAIDEESKQGLIDAGFSPDSILITGPANMEASSLFSKMAEATRRDEWRRQKGLNASDFVLVFFSDPFYLKPDGRPFTGTGGLTDDDGRSLFGYTSTETLEALLEDADSVFSKAGRDVCVVVKPHPLEDPRPLKKIIDKFTRMKVILALEENALFWIVTADAVMGMMSIALLEGALAGKPSISLEFNFKESGAEEPCRSNLMGYTKPVYQRSGLKSILEALCSGTFQKPSPPAAKRLPIEGAAKRIADAVVKNIEGVKK